MVAPNGLEPLVFGFLNLLVYEPDGFSMLRDHEENLPNDLPHGATSIRFF